MAPPWHVQDKVNNSPDVAGPPRRTWQPRTLQAIVVESWRSAPDGTVGADGDAPNTTRSPLATSRTALIWRIFPMPDAIKVGFVPFSNAARGVLVVFCDDALRFGSATEKALG